MLESLERKPDPARQESRFTRRRGFIQIARGDGAAGVMVRRLLPLCVLVPPIIGGLRLIGEHAGFFSSGSGMIFAITIHMALFIAVIAWAAATINRIDNDRDELIDSLKRGKDEAEIANRIKGAFLASMSHEIRTPLTAICGFADLLMTRTRSPEEHDDFVKTIKRNGEHLLTITNDILDLSKIEAGKMRVEHIPVSPTALIAEVCSMLRAPAIEKGLSLEVLYDGPIPATIRTDPTRLRQALINLVGNAIKFTEKGGITIVCGLATPQTDTNPMLRVGVTDTGVGLTPAQQKDLFVPFLQADIETARKFGGTGLGLSISKHLASLLGGDISVTSEPGRGSTFTLTLATGSLEGVGVAFKPFEGGAPPSALLEKTKLNGSVLLAEDGVSNQKLITCYLKKVGIKVDIAPNGQQAVDRAMSAWLAGRPYDLILMDMLMPVLDGYQATIQLRTKGYTRPIVALTANALSGDRNKCLNAGCNDFMTKPIDPAKFIKMVERQLKTGSGMPTGRPISPLSVNAA